MRTKKRSNDKVAIAITLCFCVLAIASIFTMRTSLNQLKQQPENNINIANEDQIKEEGQKVVNPVPVVDSNKGPNLEGNREPKQEEIQPISYVLPIQGTATVGYSTDFPVFSKTLEQYVIHEGVDYEAPLDTEVVAISDGTVTAVYTDDKLGITIEILHPEGITSRYCNLSTTELVGNGDVVKMGTPISKVGTSSLFESLEPAHLHFEVIKDGMKINPETFFNQQ